MGTDLPLKCPLLGLGTPGNCEVEGRHLTWSKSGPEEVHICSSLTTLQAPGHAGANTAREQKEHWVWTLGRVPAALAKATTAESVDSKPCWGEPGGVHDQPSQESRVLS